MKLSKKNTLKYLNRYKKVFLPLLVFLKADASAGVRWSDKELIVLAVIGFFYFLFLFLYRKFKKKQK